ncbi:transcription elongation factor [Thelephora terrestris]|uniref:Transcription elongation factor n=1 Tax=Thelephora terrestris TaxID=56493 RepID=A0A9P6HJG8_9AGAM|nr:transcription elongation factor [Thelephora terrestris]
MSQVAELKKLVKSLQSAQVAEAVVEILHALKKQPNINEAVLRESKAGLAVGKLRSHADKRVSDTAKDIVKKWKNDVEKAKRTTGAPKKPTVSTNASSKINSFPPSAPSPATPKVETRTAKGDGVSANWTGDKTRDKCIELLYDALAVDSGAPNDLIAQRAVAIEKEVAEELGSNSGGYKAKIRSLFVNLKDKNNPSLREGVISGDIPAIKFAKMTSEEMASGERQAANRKIVEENLFNSFGAAERQAETEAFQCGRCKQRKCRYRQAQTRSADEPMTTFVTCTICNNRWKFS